MPSAQVHDAQHPSADAAGLAELRALELNFGLVALAPWLDSMCVWGLFKSARDLPELQRQLERMPDPSSLTDEAKTAVAELLQHAQAFLCLLADSDDERYGATSDAELQPSSLGAGPALKEDLPIGHPLTGVKRGSLSVSRRSFARLIRLYDIHMPARVFGCTQLMAAVCAHALSVRAVASQASFPPVPSVIHWLQRPVLEDVSPSSHGTKSPSAVFVRALESLPRLRWSKHQASFAASDGGQHAHAKQQLALKLRRARVDARCGLLIGAGRPADAVLLLLEAAKHTTSPRLSVAQTAGRPNSLSDHAAAAFRHAAVRLTKLVCQLLSAAGPSGLPRPPAVDLPLRHTNDIRSAAVGDELRASPDRTHASLIDPAVYQECGMFRSAMFFHLLRDWLLHGPAEPIDDPVLALRHAQVELNSDVWELSPPDISVFNVLHIIRQLHLDHAKRLRLRHQASTSGSALHEWSDDDDDDANEDEPVACDDDDDERSHLDANASVHHHEHKQQQPDKPLATSAGAGSESAVHLELVPIFASSAPASAGPVHVADSCRIPIARIRHHLLRFAAPDVQPSA